MKTHRQSTSTSALAAFAFTVISAPAAVITDFSNFVESGNTLSGGNNREQSFTPSGPDVTIAHVSGGGAGQEFYLSSEFDTLAAGHRISVDLTSSPTVNNEQFGLALTNTTAPGSVQVIWAWRHADDLQLTIRDGLGGASSNLIDTTAFPDTLFIDRTGTGWSFGSISSSVETVHFNNITAAGGTSITVDGSVLGFFSDMRSTSTDKEISNLTIVPEPTSAALLGLGCLAMIFRRRR